MQLYVLCTNKAHYIIQRLKGIHAISIVFQFFYLINVSNYRSSASWLLFCIYTF